MTADAIGERCTDDMNVGRRAGGAAARRGCRGGGSVSLVVTVPPAQSSRRAPPLPEHLIWDLEPGMHADGFGLYLRVHRFGGRSWVLVFNDDGRRHELGLGGARKVSLSAAREAATRLRGKKYPLLAKG